MSHPIGRHLGGIVFAAAVAIGVAGLTRVPYEASRDESPVMRLSWRTPGQFVNECRRLSAAELERLPVHMRREEVCEGRLLPHRLIVRLDGAAVLDTLVQPAGARADRPLYVFHELPIPTGRHRLEIRWTPEREGGSTSEEATPNHEDGTLRLDTTIDAHPREIVLITYDSDRRAFRPVQR